MSEIAQGICKRKEVMRIYMAVKGWNQGELAAELNMNQATLSRYMNGADIKTSEATRICDKLGIPTRVRAEMFLLGEGGDADENGRVDGPHDGDNTV